MAVPKEEQERMIKALGSLGRAGKRTRGQPVAPAEEDADTIVGLYPHRKVYGAPEKPKHISDEALDALIRKMKIKSMT